MAERREGDGKDPVWIEQETVEVSSHVGLVEREDRIVTGLFWIIMLFTFGASLIGLVAWWLEWATPADLQRAIGVPVGVGVCIALLVLPDHWQRWFDHFLRFAVKCVLWTIALAAGLVMLALVMWRISSIDFNAPLTVGGAIIIAMIIVVLRT